MKLSEFLNLAPKQWRLVDFWECDVDIEIKIVNRCNPERHYRLYNKMTPQCTFVPSGWYIEIDRSLALGSYNIYFSEFDDMPKWAQDIWGRNEHCSTKIQEVTNDSARNPA